MCTRLLYMVKVYKYLSHLIVAVQRVGHGVLWAFPLGASGDFKDAVRSRTSTWSLKCTALLLTVCRSIRSVFFLPR